MYDNILIYLFWDFQNNRVSSTYRKFNQKVSKYPNINNYLLNRYKDSESRIESLLRLVYNIEQRPVCKFCGNPVKFIGKPNSKGIFSIFCSEECRRKNINTVKVKKTKLEKYGNENYCNPDKAKQTKLERYGNENYNNREKALITNLAKYGVKQFNNKEKAKQTLKEKYNNENYNNREKYKETCLKKYNVPFYVNEYKMMQTKIEKYGHIFTNPEKIKQAKKEKYGDENYVNVKKVKQTKLERYGDPTYNNLEKIYKTKLEKYGDPKYVNILKISETKRKNNTFNKSKPEDESYILLKEKYPNVIRQYRSELYPFNCDFYIPSLDLYIECNYMWTHGLFPYIEAEQRCIDKLNLWKSRNTKFYNKAIETWTIRDIKKRNIAKENNLNWIEFFNINELKEWLVKN